MFGKPEIHSPQHWRKLAEEARTMADGLVTEANRRQMLALAEDYEHLAEQAQREQDRAAPRPAPSLFPDRRC